LGAVQQLLPLPDHGFIVDAAVAAAVMPEKFLLVRCLLFEVLLKLFSWFTELQNLVQVSLI